ncbi:hypothetical protein C8J56DRAFT_890586 [Mycena floridula]|nr:hypothetical protein C8J56DRAFT_890586 [Mycena floridula]
MEVEELPPLPPSIPNTPPPSFETSNPVVVVEMPLLSPAERVEPVSMLSTLSINDPARVEEEPDEEPSGSSKGKKKAVAIENDEEGEDVIMGNDGEALQTVNPEVAVDDEGFPLITREELPPPVPRTGEAASSRGGISPKRREGFSSQPRAGTNLLVNRDISNASRRPQYDSYCSDYSRDSSCPRRHNSRSRSLNHNQYSRRPAAYDFKRPGSSYGRDRNPSPRRYGEDGFELSRRDDSMDDRMDQRSSRRHMSQSIPMAMPSIADGSWRPHHGSNSLPRQRSPDPSNEGSKEESLEKRKPSWRERKRLRQLEESNGDQPRVIRRNRQPPLNENPDDEKESRSQKSRRRRHINAAGFALDHLGVVIPDVPVKTVNELLDLVLDDIRGIPNDVLAQIKWGKKCRWFPALNRGKKIVFLLKLGYSLESKGIEGVDNRDAMQEVADGQFVEDDRSENPEEVVEQHDEEDVLEQYGETGYGNGDNDEAGYWEEDTGMNMSRP